MSAKMWYIIQQIKNMLINILQYVCAYPLLFQIYILFAMELFIKDFAC